MVARRQSSNLPRPGSRQSALDCRSRCVVIGHRYRVTPECLEIALKPRQVSFNPRALGAISRRVTFRVTSRAKNLKAVAHRRKQWLLIEESKSLVPSVVRKRSLYSLVYCMAVLDP